VIAFDSIAAWREERARHIEQRVTLGFVPTMGAIHEGHLSLVDRSRAENDRTLVSIFVNPTQFNDPSDRQAYPQPIDRDLELLRNAGTDFVLLPRPADIYRDGYRFRVSETSLSRTLEGAHRPGHFDGVLTVVLKLFQIAQAHRAYFGEKDWQQLMLVRQMAEAFFLSTQVVACPTVREHDGLAYSSRNVRLRAGQRERAPAFYRILFTAATVDDAVRELRGEGFTVDYVEEQDGRRLAAVRLGDVRLIDNVAVSVQ
jgi:pantoate--beta-alanine ligase